MKTKTFSRNKRFKFKIVKIYELKQFLFTISRQKTNVVTVCYFAHVLFYFSQKIFVYLT